MNTLFRKELGFLFDACYILVCKTTSRNTWIKDFIKSGSEESDLGYISNVLDLFDAPDKKMELICYHTRHTDSLIIDLLRKYVNNNINTWNRDSFLAFLSDVDMLKQMVAMYYFETEHSENILHVISEKQNLDVSLKFNLMNFFLFPEKYVDLLSNELLKIFRTLDRYYTEKLSVLLDCQEEFDYSKILDINLPTSKIKGWNKQMRKCYCSFTLVNKYLIEKGKDEQEGWLVLGYEYTKLFSGDVEEPIDVASLTNAFGDKIRVKIIDLLRDHGELTLADLARLLGIVNTIAIYHLDILKKEKLLLHRYQGRKVYYCINENQVLKGINEIRKLCGITTK